MKLFNTLSHPLHRGQPVIETSSLRHLRGFTHVIVDSPQEGMPLMGIAYSKEAGVGKTTSVLCVAREYGTQSHTASSGIVLIELSPGIPAVGFLEAFLDTLGERPRGRTRTALVRQTIEAVKGNDLKLVIFDEANWFVSKVFEMARFIHGQTRCPMLLIGLSDILTVIEPFEQLKSRAFLRHEFKPLKRNEILEHFLPGLNFSRWSFTPESNEDRQMGELIWHIAGSSLRRTTFLVQIANKVAVEHDHPHVTIDHLKTAMGLSDVARMLTKMEQEEAGNEESNVSGSHEELSEKKRAAKDKKRTGHKNT